MSKKLSEEEKALLDNFKKGMFRESGADGYRAFNAKSGALGKYQFVPYWHLNDMIAFAKENEKIYGKVEVPTLDAWQKGRKTWNEQEMKDFFEPILGNVAFQDGFFNSQEAKIIPKATEQYNQWGKKLGWSLEAFMALNHIKGTDGSSSVLKQANGDPNAKILHEEIDENNKVSVARYVNDFETEIKANNGKLSRDEKYTPDGKGDNPASGKRLAELLDRHKNILTSPDLDDQEKTTAMEVLWEDVKSSNLTDAYGVMMDNYNIKKEREIKEFQTGESAGGLINQLVQNNLNGMVVDKNNNFEIGLREEDLKKLKEKLTPEQYKDFTKGMTKKSTVEMAGTKENRITLYKLKGDAVRLLDIPDKEYRNLTDKNLYLDVNGSLETDENGNPKFHTVDAKQNLKVVPDFSQVKYDTKPDFSKVRDVREEKRIKDEADAQKIKDEAEKSTDEVDKAKTNQNKVDQKSINKRAEDYFGSQDVQIEQTVPDTFDYQTGDFKKELPLEALGQGGLALMGMGDAKTELPLRDEQVSEAIVQFMNTQKKLSQVGLKPEEEAEMKNQISEVYQSSVNALTRASNGNRNVVLGGMENANATRLKGLSTIAIADIQRKDAAYAEYGKTLEYIENFNTTRDTANHKIKYDEAVAKKAAGSALAASGFSSMLEELQYQKENGPGSANHMLKQQMMFRAFGVVPGMKDDGTGTKVGTASYAQKLKSNIDNSNNDKAVNNALNTNVKNKWAALSVPEQNALMEQGFDKKMNTPEAKKRWLEDGIISNGEKGVANAWNPSVKTQLEKPANASGIVQAQVGGYQEPIKEPSLLATPTPVADPQKEMDLVSQYLKAKTGIFDPVLPNFDQMNKTTYQSK